MTKDDAITQCLERLATAIEAQVEAASGEPMGIIVIAVRKEQDGVAFTQSNLPENFARHILGAIAAGGNNLASPSTEPQVH